MKTEIEINLSDEEIAKLDEYAIKYNMTRDEFIEQLLINWIKNEHPIYYTESLKELHKIEL